MTSVQLWLTLPVAFLVIQTFIILLNMGFRRFKAAKLREVDVKYYKLYQDGQEPESTRKFARNYQNLFEMPVLFYAGVLLTLQLNLESMLLAYLAWSYWIFRLIHSYIHCTSNTVIWRFRLFLLSTIILMVYWGMLFSKIVSNF